MTTRPMRDMSPPERRVGASDDRPFAEGDFTARLAHELRNPLAGIRMACRNLQHDTADQELKARIGPIIQEVDRLIGTLNRHLGYARQAGEPPRRIRLASLLEGIRRLTWPQASQGIHIGACVPADLTCLLPEMGLRQALWNLLTNAWQAIGSETGEIIITAQARHGLLRITVADNGPGFPDEMLRALPTAPMTTKAEGSGLGLLQVRGYVQGLGGELLLANRPGHGAEVTLIVPCEHSP